MGLGRPIDNGREGTWKDTGHSVALGSVVFTAFLYGNGT